MSPGQPRSNSVEPAIAWLAIRSKDHQIEKSSHRPFLNSLLSHSRAILPYEVSTILRRNQLFRSIIAYQIERSPCSDSKQHFDSTASHYRPPNRSIHESTHCQIRQPLPLLFDSLWLPRILPVLYPAHRYLPRRINHFRHAADVEQASLLKSYSSTTSRPSLAVQKTRGIYSNAGKQKRWNILRNPTSSCHWNSHSHCRNSGE